MDNVNLCIAYENGARSSDNGCMEEVHNYFNENEEDMYGED
jgi:hypothetical protein